MDDGDKVRKEWDKASEGWKDFVRTGKDFTRDGLNNPTTFALLGNVNGLIVLDLACGEGYNARILASKGAEVIGVDFSSKMIELAKEEEFKESLGIHYLVLDASNLLGLDDDYFDLVVCFMALQDIEDYEKAISEVSRVLKLRGRFVFSIPHPCFEKITVDGERIDVADRYFEETKYPIHWNMERLSIPFSTISFHRPLTDYFDALNRNGLCVFRLVEPKLTEEAYRKYPFLRDALVRPQSVIIESMKAIL